MKQILLIILFSIFSVATFSQEKKKKNANYYIEVRGNCEQCQKRIQKAALSVKGVKFAEWNIETHQIRIILNELRTNILEVKKAIAKVGHDSEDVKAEDAVYDDLSECCKYERG